MKNKDNADTNVGNKGKFFVIEGTDASGNLLNLNY
jgi:hypothetical protein